MSVRAASQSSARGRSSFASQAINKDMDYNTNRAKLRMPEFVRNIQQMVDYCRSIEDRQARQACAESIASILCRLFPEEMGAQWPNTKAWDTIQILAGFDLDVDFPCPVITEENVRPEPVKIPYFVNAPQMKIYGRIIENMACAVADMEEGPDKEEAVWRLAMQMKKILFAHNSEAAEDYIVLRDLAQLTKGRINLNPDVYRLREIAVPAQQNTTTAKSKKKKKKK